MGNDAPPQYFAPPAAGATKLHPDQSQGVEMPRYGAGPQGAQQSGVVGSSVDVEQGQGQGQSESLPPRPPQAAKAKIMGALERFRR